MKRLTQERSYFVAKDNQLITKSRYSLSLRQQRILLFFISRIKPMDDENTLYEFEIKDFIKVCGYDDTSGNYYPVVKSDIKSLADVSNWIEVAKGKEQLFRWINTAEINRQSGKILISFHSTVARYLFNLRERYTQYSLSNVLCLKHKYSIRLYEYLSTMKYLEQFEISVDELKKRIDAEQYTKFADFEKRVLKPSIQEIDFMTDLFVDVATRKTGRQITHIRFTYREKTAYAMTTAYRLQDVQLNPSERKKVKQEKAEIERRIKEREQRQLEAERETVQYTPEAGEQFQTIKRRINGEWTETTVIVKDGVARLITPETETDNKSGAEIIAEWEAESKRILAERGAEAVKEWAAEQQKQLKMREDFLNKLKAE